VSSAARTLAAPRGPVRTAPTDAARDRARALDELADAFVEMLIADFRRRPPRP